MIKKTLNNGWLPLPLIFRFHSKITEWLQKNTLFCGTPQGSHLHNPVSKKIMWPCQCLSPQVPFLSMNITGSKRSLRWTCVCKSIHTSESLAVGHLKFVRLISQKPWDHMNLTFPVRSHLPGTLWTEISPLYLKRKVKACRKPQHSQDFHYDAKEVLPATCGWHSEQASNTS